LYRVAVSTPSFDNLRVLVLESRRAQELASLVTTYGGNPLVAPSMREIPLESNTDAVVCAEALEQGQCDLLVLLTGVGTRALADAVERVRGKRESFIDALRRTRIAARGPKPAAVLREWGVPVWLIAPEPNTWRELVTALDERSAEVPLAGARVFVQEYGASNPQLLTALASRGALVTRVPVYQWALPEDLEPLRWAVHEIADGKIDVALFTTATQIVHLLQVADSMQLHEAVVAGLRHTVVASIGPTTSEELREQGVAIDMEPSHPKMGFLVREAAERAHALRERKGDRF
jgi:uroporphyrinogen-III synthase